MSKDNVAIVVGIVAKQGGIKLRTLIREAEKAGVKITQADLLSVGDDGIALTADYDAHLDFLAYSMPEAEGRTNFFIVPAGTEFATADGGDDEEEEADETELSANVIDETLVSRYFVAVLGGTRDGQVTSHLTPGAALGAAHAEMAGGSVVQVFGGLPIEIEYTHRLSLPAPVLAAEPESEDDEEEAQG